MRSNPAAIGLLLADVDGTLGIPSGQIATIGDSPNGVLMFRKGRLSMAMGNASDEVKRQAEAVTDSRRDEGVAKGFERLILGADAFRAVAEAG